MEKDKIYKRNNLIKAAVAFLVLIGMQDLKSWNDIIFAFIALGIGYAIYRESIKYSLLKNNILYDGVILNYRFEIANDNTSNLILRIQTNNIGDANNCIEIKTISFKKPEIGTVVKFIKDEEENEFLLVDKGEKLISLFKIITFSVIDLAIIIYIYNWDN